MKILHGSMGEFFISWRVESFSNMIQNPESIKKQTKQSNLISKSQELLREKESPQAKSKYK